MGEVDWVLVITFMVGMAVGGFSVAVGIAHSGLMSATITVPPAPAPPTLQTPTKRSLTDIPKYNPLTRKIDHRN